jgi:putative transposase
MGRPYSNDLRERVVGTVIKGGLSRHQAAAQFGVGISTAINWVRRFGETGSVEPDQSAAIGRRRLRGRTAIGWCNGAGRRILPCAG